MDRPPPSAPVTMASLVGLLVSTVAPPLAVTTVGYVLGSWRSVETEALNTVVVYVLLPALVFDSLVTSPVEGIYALAAAVVAFTLAMLLFAAAAGRALGATGTTLDVLLLAGAFPNVGNFGIPVATFAFGVVGRSTAVVFVVVQNVLIYTLGVFIVSRSGAAGSRQAVGRVFSLPLLYAVVAAGLVVALGVVPPADSPSMRTVGMLGDASIPLFLLILGLQLSGMHSGTALRDAIPAAGLKLLVAPLIALGVVGVIGLSDPTVAAAFVLLAAGPAAVLPLVLFVEFDGAGSTAADRYATTVVLTLLGSVPAVAAVLAALRAGLLG